MTGLADVTGTAVDRSPAGAPADDVVCRVVADASELAEARRIRHAVFVGEQAVFAGSDTDFRDARPDVLHVVAVTGGRTVGTVRLYPLDDAGLWQGDRLAVLPDRRAIGAGGPLVRFAVATAAAAGGIRMVAHVQRPNRRFFERLGWRSTGEEIYAGLPHVAMEIDLQ